MNSKRAAVFKLSLHGRCKDVITAIKAQLQSPQSAEHSSITVHKTLRSAMMDVIREYNEGAEVIDLHIIITTVSAYIRIAVIQSSTAITNTDCL